MKKTLALLTFSLLLCAAMLLGASAYTLTDAENGIGYYVRFDTQADVANHASFSTGDPAGYETSFSTAEVAMMTNVRAQAEWHDNRYTINLNGNKIDLNEYPYMRLTYKVPTTTIDGRVNGYNNGDSATAANVSAFIFANGTYSGGSITAGGLNIQTWLPRNDKYNRMVIDWRDASGGAKYVVSGETSMESQVTSFSVDIPNNISGNVNFEMYIWDLGFFKTAEDAASFSYNQEYYLTDMSDPSVAETWALTDSTSTSTLVYESDDEMGGYTTLKYGVVASGNDTRISSPAFDGRYWFNPNEMPYFTVLGKTNQTTSLRMLDEFYTEVSGAGTTANLTGANSFTKKQIIYPSTTIAYANDETWKIGYVNMSGSYNDTAKVFKVTDAVAMANHAFDPMDSIASSDGDEYFSMKYVAYFPTEDMAKLYPQAAPTGLVAVAPANNKADALGTITGVTTDMEYRIAGDETWTDVTGTSISVAPGKSYDIRYKAKEGYNAGIAATVAVPYFWDVNIYGLRYTDDNRAVDATVKKIDKAHWEITVPYGTDLSLTKFWVTTSVTSGIGGINLYDGVYTDSKNINVCAGNYIDGDTAVYRAYSYEAISEPVYVTFTWAEPLAEVTEGDDGEALLAAIVNDTIDADGNPANVLHSALLGNAATETAAADIVIAYIEKIGARYGAEATAVSAGNFTAPVAATSADNREGTDGTLDVTIGVGDYDVTITVKLPAKHFPMIYNLSSPVLFDHIKPVEGVSKSVVEATTEDGAYDGAYVNLDRPDVSTELNIVIDPGVNGIPEITQLADYSYIVYRYKLSTSGGNQIYFYTDGYSGGHSYQGLAPVDAIGTWANNKFALSATANQAAAVMNMGDTAWANYLKQIRFDFIRGVNVVRNANVDYIGLFATEAEAQAFMDNPILDYASETQDSINEKYAEYTAKFSDYAKKMPAITVAQLDTDADGIASYRENLAAIKKYFIDPVIGSDNAYPVRVVYTNQTSAADEENLISTGSLIFNVVFADSTINGYATTTNNTYAFVMPVVSGTSFYNMTGATLGAQIRNATESENGQALRFGTSLACYADYKAAAEAEGFTIARGTLVTSSALLGENELTFELAEQLNAEGAMVADVSGETIYSGTEEDTLVYTAAIYGIPEAEYDTALTARAYVKYMCGGEVVHVQYFDEYSASVNDVIDASGWLG